MILDAIGPDAHVATVLSVAACELRELLEQSGDVEVVVLLQAAAVIDRGAGVLVLPAPPSPALLQRLELTDRMSLAACLRAIADALDPSSRLRAIADTLDPTTQPQETPGMPYSLERIALAIDNREDGLAPAAFYEARDRLELQALELARAAELLLALVPGEASPVVIQRMHFAELQAALDAYGDAGADLVLASEEPDDA